MDNVRRLKVVERAPTDKPRPQPKVIDYLKRTLARAESGELQAAAVAYVSADGFPCTGWHRGDTPPATSFVLITAAACLQHEMVEELNAAATLVPPPSEEPA